jgi:hypothetical protein
MSSACARRRHPSETSPSLAPVLSAGQVLLAAACRRFIGRGARAGGAAAPLLPSAWSPLAAAEGPPLRSRRARRWPVPLVTVASMLVIRCLGKGRFGGQIR